MPKDVPEQLTERIVVRIPAALRRSMRRGAKAARMTESQYIRAALAAAKNGVSIAEVLSALSAAT